jgi:hypothetical protein
MDLSKIVSNTESLLYQVTAWLVLVPKSLFKAISSPAWIPEYVAAELAKPAERRYDAYMSPLLLFVLVCVVPNMIANAYWPEIRFTDFATRRATIEELKNLPSEHGFLAYAIIWIVLPLSFALVQLRARKEEFTSSGLRPLLFIQCMRIAPLGLLFALRFVAEKVIAPDIGVLVVMNTATIVVGVAWLFYSDVRISVQTLGVSRARAFGLAVLSIALYYILIASLMLRSHFKA